MQNTSQDVGRMDTCIYIYIYIFDIHLPKEETIEHKWYKPKWYLANSQTEPDEANIVSK